MNFEGEGDPSEGVSMERSAEMLEQQGYTEVEEQEQQRDIYRM